MAWQNLPTDYTDAAWVGLKKYIQQNNTDGTISFEDVTVYTQKEKSFFGALDANRMNEAMNYIMAALENDTDLYTDFLTYFDTQQGLFEDRANDVIEDVRALTNAQYDSYRTYVAGLETEGNNTLREIEHSFEVTMATYETEQKQAFDMWFESVKGQLSEDAAGNLQNQVNGLDGRVAEIEYMILNNDFYDTLTTDDGEALTDDFGEPIVADWHYKKL